VNTTPELEQIEFQTSELDLADMGVAPVVVEGEKISLPAALCDDLLIEELESIPNQMGFKIGDVADLLGVKQYILRYWESEFDLLKPKKAANNQRFYTRRDVENAFLIRKLLHRDRFSIEGARAAVKDLRQFVKKEKDWSQFSHRLETVQERARDLVEEVRKMRALFR
jgi:DNA-binding transcriptional MerR regulator